MTQLRKLFFRLPDQPAYKGLSYSDSDYFNLSKKETRIATTHHEQRSPTPEQAKHVIQSMLAKTEIDRRNRALLSFVLLTGARDLRLRQ